MSIPTYVRASLVIVVTILLYFITVYVAAILTPMPANAVPTVPTVPNGNSQTCSAFSTWNHHRTLGNLESLMSRSTTAQWKYLGGDVWQMYGDIRADGLSGKYVSRDIKFVQEDCSK